MSSIGWEAWLWALCGAYNVPSRQTTLFLHQKYADRWNSHEIPILTAADTSTLNNPIINSFSMGFILPPRFPNLLMALCWKSELDVFQQPKWHFRVRCYYKWVSFASMKKGCLCFCKQKYDRYLAEKDSGRIVLP